MANRPRSKNPKKAEMNKSNPQKDLNIHDFVDSQSKKNLHPKDEARYRYLIEQTSEGFYKEECAKPISISLPVDEQIKQMYKQLYVTECNDVFAKMYGYPNARALKGIKIVKLHGDVDVPENIDTSKLFIKNGYKIIDAETREVDINGDSIYFLNNAVGIIENNQLVAIWGIQKNITEQKRAQITLETSRQKLALHVEKTPLGVIEWNLNFEVEAWNPASEKIFGFSEKKALGKHASFIVPQITREHVDKIWSELLKKQGGERSTNENITQDGQIILCEWYNTPLIDDYGKVIGVASLVMDITERHEAEEKLAVSKELYSALFETSPSGIITLDLNGTITSANSTLLNMLGLEKEDIKGVIFNQVKGLNKDYLEEYDRIFKGLLEGKSYRNIEWPFNLMDGSEKWFSLNADSLRIHGEVIGLQVVVNDITEQRLAQQALMESEEKYRQLIEQSSDAIYLLFDRRFEIVNQKFLSMFQLTVDDINKPDFDFIDLVADESKALIEDRVARKARGEELEPKYEFTAITKEGKKIILEASLSYINYKGQIAAQGVLRDITERHKLEEQLRQAQKMEAVGQLAGGVAHDFNNLLTVISGYSDLLLTDPQLEKKQHDKIAQIGKAGKRAQQLTNQLLAFGRKQIFKPEVLDINDVISHSINMFTRLIGEDIEIKLNLDPDLPPILADPSQLEQILINLIVNARDAIYDMSSEPDEKIISIKTSSAFLDEKFAGKHLGTITGKKILLSVSDNGVGMNEDTLSKIFEPFFTTKSSGKGTGLGLSTVYGIVKQNNANIYAYSHPNKGTTVKMYWPLAETDTELGNDVEEDKNIKTGLEKILFVEDDEGVREFGAKALMDIGYTVYSVSTAEKALKLLKKDEINIDLLITDLIMPGINGRDLAVRIQKKYSGLPVIFVSGYTDNHIVHHGVLDSDVHFIQKPYSISSLSHKIREVLDKK
jgi:PAS domain S-box-containing protein